MRRDQRSAEAEAWRRLYDDPAWSAAREVQLSKQPLCERCLKSGRDEPATVVNHRIPHKGDRRLFLEPENHESSCKPHHDGLIQREERRGYQVGCDQAGRPIDPNHPWNRGPTSAPPDPRG